MSERVKFWYGSKSAYDNLENKDVSSLYFITDTGNECIYKGSVLVSANHTTKLASLEETTNRKVEVKFDDSKNTLIFY